MQTQYSVIGMTCSHCAASVTEEISDISGVTGVEADFESGSVVVTSDSVVELSAVDAAVTEAGYRLAS